DRPFHPARLWHFVTEQLDSGAFGGILRSKGFFRLATRPGVTGLWSQAGSVARFEPTGVDEGRTEPGRGPEPDPARDVEPGPDGQELVFIGTGLRAGPLHAALA